MAITVCLGAYTLYYPSTGGHFWVYLNWALGLRALGCRVVWLEMVKRGCAKSDKLPGYIAVLKQRLERYGLADSLALCSSAEDPLPRETYSGCLNVDAASEADLLLNMLYGMPPEIVSRFRRSALVDIDPGLLQSWMNAGDIRVASHDFYFSTGETVGRPGARFPDLGLAWRYTPPCVATAWWPVRSAAADAPFSTATHWNSDEWMFDGTELYSNDKRTGFLPYLDLPKHTGQPLELAICLGKYDQDEGAELRQRGWRIRDAQEVTATPWSYQSYIQRSRGEFSCVKPSCIRYQNAWASDRTLCYLASGKPAVVQHTGQSQFLPDAAGLFRFCNLEEAVRYLELVAADYERQCKLARELAVEYFDANTVVGRLLEQALN